MNKPLIEYITSQKVNADIIILAYTYAQKLNRPKEMVALFCCYEDNILYLTVLFKWYYINL